MPMIGDKLKSLLNGGASKAGVEGLQLEIAGLEAEKETARSELCAMPAKRANLMLFAENAAEIDALEVREQSLYRDVERLDVQIAALQGRLTEQRNIRRKKRIEFHRKALRDACEKLGVALAKAMQANEAALSAYAAATAEIGEADSLNLFSRVHFGGLLTRECLDLWQTQTHGTNEDHPIAVPPAARPKPVQVVVNAMAPKSAPLQVVTKRVPRAALPDQIPEGHVRVTVLRGGYESPAGEQLIQGDEVDIPKRLAELAAQNGAVDLAKVS